MADAPADDVREFFDRQQLDNQYESLKAMTRELDVDAARILNERAVGDVLSIGGIWDFFEWPEAMTSLTVMDLSPEMLKAYCPDGATGVVGDVYEHDFEPKSFDTIVFPLMLHHTPQGSWKNSEARLERALDRARSWLRDGGHVVILEYCPQPAWMPLQKTAMPATSWFLKTFKQPLVAMYPTSFYDRVMKDRFGTVEIHKVDPPAFDDSKWYPIFMSIRWLKVPLRIYPKLHVITGPAPDALAS